MKKYIWQNSEYPNFTYDKELIIPLLSNVRLKQGILLGKMNQLGFENSQFAVLNVLTEDVIKSSEIEGLKLNTEQVRSSIAKRLGLNIGDDIYIERDLQNGTLTEQEAQELIDQFKTNGVYLNAIPNDDFTVTDGSLSEKCNGSNGEYYTHPAFTFGNTKLNGFWIMYLT